MSRLFGCPCLKVTVVLFILSHLINDCLLPFWWWGSCIRCHFFSHQVLPRYQAFTWRRRRKCQRYIQSHLPSPPPPHLQHLWGSNGATGLPEGFSSMVHPGRPWLGNEQLMRNGGCLCKPTNSKELLLGGFLQPYAWNLFCFAHCQAVSRSKREESRISNLGKIHLDHHCLQNMLPRVATLTSPPAASLVQESSGRWQGQLQQRSLAHSLPQ